MSAVAIPNLAQLEKIKTLTIVVASPETELAARVHLNEVRAAGRQLDKDIKTMKAPHQAEIKRVDDSVREWKSMLAERDQSLERALLDYGRKVRLAAEEANRKILERYEKKVDKVEAKAILENKPMPLVLPPQMVATPQKTVEAEGAKQTVVKRKAWRLKPGYSEQMSVQQFFAMRGVTNLEEIWPDDFPPPEYFFLDLGRIGKVVRAGGTVKGIEVYEEESIAVKAS